MKKILVSAALLGGVAYVVSKKAREMVLRRMNKGKKILFVVSGHGKLGHTNEHTGYYLSEVAHPWWILSRAGYEIDFVSPNGGTPPVDGFELIDPINRKFWNDQKYQKKIIISMKPSDIDPDEYSAIFYAGGHGAMWDFPPNAQLADITRRIYEAGGVVAAVCHGPAGLVNVHLSDGKYLIKDKKITGFANEEEVLMKREEIVPFLLEDKLKEHGGRYEKGIPMMPHVVVDERLITGQNPASALGVGKHILKKLLSLHLSEKEKAQH